MKRLAPYLWEIGKWAVVIALLLPLLHPRGGMLEFARVVVGEALLIIFVGKLFYDTVIWKFTRRRRSAGQDAFSLLGMLAAAGIVLALFLTLVGVTLMQYFRSLSAGPLP